MPRFFAFLVANLRWLAAGFLLTFGSAFGQTWFISLSAPYIKQEYGLTDGSWGGLYTLATLSSAALMFWRGSAADRVPLSRLGAGTAVVFAVAAAGMAFGRSIWMLLGSLFLLRFCGQGMFGHIAMTAMGRWFIARRGQAIAVANLGYPASEILLAASTILVIGSVGWRSTWLIAAAVILLGILPPIAVLLRSTRTAEQLDSSSLRTGLGGRHWQRRDAAGHWLLPALLPAMLTPGFIGTVVFFHQTHVAEVKGWQLVQMAPGFTALAVSGVISSFTAGWAADRFGVAKLLPLLLVPMGLGIGFVGPSESVYAWYFALAMIGITMGIASALWGVLLPVVYGTEHLGAIRSLAVTIMVFSTAIGPGLTGLLIDRGIDFPTQCLALGGWCLLASCGGLVIERRLSREIGATPQT
ncbi:MAG: MFS transporter [Pirellulales bacterium]|jgi:MFS family permease|nr:MFS transporter [Pirellulales bacterium]